jgi:hypothetical protein
MLRIFPEFQLIFLADDVVVLAEGKKHHCIPLAIKMHNGKITQESFKDKDISEVEKDICVSKM